MNETTITELCEMSIQYVWHIIRATSQRKNK